MSQMSSLYYSTPSSKSNSVHKW